MTEKVVDLSFNRKASINGRTIFFKDYTKIFRDRNLKHLSRFFDKKFGKTNLTGLQPLNAKHIVAALYYMDDLDPISFYTTLPNVIFVKNDLAKEFLGENETTK